MQGSVFHTFASHRGLRGKNGAPTISRTAGTNWIPQASLKLLDECSEPKKLHPYPM